MTHTPMTLRSPSSILRLQPHRRRRRYPTRSNFSMTSRMVDSSCWTAPDSWGLFASTATGRASAEFRRRPSSRSGALSDWELRGRVVDGERDLVHVAPEPGLVRLDRPDDG